MKKILSLILVLSMLFTFLGCGNKDTIPTTATESTVAETEHSELTNSTEEFVKPENYATVLLITINPQLRLYLDADGIVLAVEAVNKDAKEIKASISSENSNYETVVETIVTTSGEKGYIKNDTVIRVEITEVNDPSVDTTTILNKITIIVNQTASKLELAVELKTEDKTAAEKQPDVGVPEPTEVPTTAPTTSSTVTTPTTPTQCSHTYKDATCTAPKTCSKCGATAGNATGHNWSNATCTTPKTCKTCKTTEGNASGHSWKNVTCTSPKTCSNCGATEGSAAGHSYKDATCTAPKTCSACGATEGNASGHSWKNVTCTSPKTCSNCGATEGGAAGHSYKDATCTAPKTCSACGATEGSAIAHTYVNNICSICNAINGLNPKENIIDGLDYVGKFHEPTATAPALMFDTEASGCFVTTRYFTTDPEEASSGGWDYNGSHYYSIGGGFTPYHAHITDTELIVTTESYLEDNGTVSIKAIMLKDGNLKITYSTLTDYPVGLILYADIANAFK